MAVESNLRSIKVQIKGFNPYYNKTKLLQISVCRRSIYRLNTKDVHSVHYMYSSLLKKTIETITEMVMVSTTKPSAVNH